MRKIVAIIILLWGGTAQAQDDSTDVIEGDWICGTGLIQHCSKVDVKAYFDYFANSNGISNSFINAFLFDDFISTQVKDDASSLLSNTNNRLGVNIDAGVTVKINAKKNSKGLFGNLTKVIGVGQRQFATLGFSKNFFELYFRGNKQFAGESIQAGPLDYTNFGYQYFGVGFEKRINGKNQIGVAVNFLNGKNFTQATISNAELFTSASGDSINFTSQLELTQSQTSQANGAGVSLDLQFIREVNSKLDIQLDVSDIGFISWKDMDTFTADSTWGFTGVSISNILNIDGSEFQNVESDSITSILGIRNQRSNKSYLLPTKIQLKGLYRHSGQLHFEVGTRYYLKASNIPRLWLKSMYNAGGFKPSITLAYGGFSKLDGALGLEYFNGTFGAAINAFYFESLINSAKTTGQGINFSFRYSF